MVGLATANRHLDRLDQATEQAVQALELAGEAGYRMLEGHAGSALAQIQLASHPRPRHPPHRRTRRRAAALACGARDLADAGATPEADPLRDLLATAGYPLGSDR
jgi:hypothetical protein